MKAASDSAQDRHGRTRRRRLLVPLSVSTALLSLASLGSVHALINASAAAPAQGISTGSVAVGTTGPGGGSSTISFSSGHPGASVVQSLSVDNTGTLGVRYAVSSQVVSGSSDLAGGLTLTVRSGVADCTAAGFTASGVQLFDGVLATTTKTAKIGDPATGAHAGDRDISASASDVLCLRVAMPTTASNSLQGLSTAVSLSFDAEQRRNT